MLRLRIWIGILTLWLFFFFNIERITQPVNIAKYVYILAPLALVIIFAFPRGFREYRVIFLIVLLLLIYTALKLFVKYPIAGHSLPIIVTEASALILTTLVGGQIARIIYDFEDTIEKMTFRQIGLPPRLLETIDTEEIYREVKRCRRFQHSLALLVVEPESEANTDLLNRMIKDLERNMLTRYIQARLAKSLSEELRDIDLIASFGGGFVVVLPETNLSEAQRMGEILKASITSRLGMNIQMGIAGFPENALTLGGLLDYAQGELKSSA